MTVTVSLRAGEREEDEARALAARFGLAFVPRDEVDTGATCLVVTKDGVRLEHDGKGRAWHPAMLHALREAGGRHPLVRLSGAARGDVVVDCTLGLGTDARFLSEWTGTRVIGLEVSPMIAAWTWSGLGRARADVDVVLADATAWLSAQPDRSVDVIVADPMFPDHRRAHPNNSLDPVRWLGDHRTLDEAWRDQALRVARKGVVVRALRSDPLPKRLGAPIVDARRDRVTVYGAWRLDGVDPIRGS